MLQSLRGTWSLKRVYNRKLGYVSASTWTRDQTMQEVLVTAALEKRHLSEMHAGT